MLYWYSRCQHLWCMKKGTGKTLGAWRAWRDLRVPCREEETMTALFPSATSWAVTKMPEDWLWEQQHEDGWRLLLCFPQSDVLLIFYTYFSVKNLIINQIAISDHFCFLQTIVIFGFFCCWFFFFNIKFPVVWNTHLTHNYLNGESMSSVTVRNKISLRSLKVTTNFSFD